VANIHRTVRPDLQRSLAKRIRTATYAADSSHVPMRSNPSPVIDLIRIAAKAVKITTGSTAA
jgi:hypothetical protein